MSIIAIVSMRGDTSLHTIDAVVGTLRAIRRCGGSLLLLCASVCALLAAGRRIFFLLGREQTHGEREERLADEKPGW